jgi:hypothetical protein
MSSNRRQGQPPAAHNHASGSDPQRHRAQMFGAGQGVEEEKKRREQSSPEPQNAAPTVGKTGGRGAKAERPSEGSDRKQAKKPPVEVTRTSKPPAETPNARAK